MTFEPTLSKYVHDTCIICLQAMNNLVKAELAFCDELAMGVETYIEPLRKILPEPSHTTMFLGLTEVHREGG